MDILFLSSEVYPFSKTGGLADVSAALPRALASLGVNIVVATPYYTQFLPPSLPFSLTPHSFSISWQGQSSDLVIHRSSPLLFENGGSLEYWLIQHEYFERDGMYGPPNAAYDDNIFRFSFFSIAALLYYLSTRSSPPQIIHINDWHTSMIPAQVAFLLNQFPLLEQSRIVLTIHNLCFQGLTDLAYLDKLDYIPPSWIKDQVYEIWGKLNPLKGAILKSHLVTTVSPTYAQEIRTSKFGCGLDPILQQRTIHGVLNGVDYSIWSPARDPFLSHHYTTDRIAGKLMCKQELLNTLQITSSSNPLCFVIISRITPQKGFDILIPALRALFSRTDPSDAPPFIFCILGLGDPQLEAELTQLSSQYPQLLYLNFTYSEKLAHLYIAAGDVLVMPSAFEPCGLTQLYAKKYGTLPLVTPVGGLKDTVQHLHNGFVIPKYSSSALLHALDEVISLYQHSPSQWKTMMERAMQDDHSWIQSARKYLSLYSQVLSF